MTQHNDRPQLQHFFRWIEGATTTGFNNLAADQTTSFVPFSAIASYFGNLPRLRGILQAIFEPDDHNLDVEQIQAGYPRVLCILICINRGRYISHFAQFETLSDIHLGWSQIPSEFPLTATNDSFVAEFLREQWIFCIPSITSVTTRQLAKESIWPVNSKEKIASGVSADIYKIFIHKDYDKLPLDHHEVEEGKQARCFALKVYRGANAQRHFDTETRGYQKLRDHATVVENIVQFYGGYVQNGKYFLILEYADCGSLEDLFLQVEQPSTGEEILDFWNEMFGIIQALFRIHSILSPEGLSESDVFRGWHQDVRPANILVCRRSSSPGFGYRFLLSDLGLCHFKKVDPHIQAVDTDSRGSRTYGAPDCYRFNTSIARAPLQVRQSIDIWSLGCVYSEAAVWVTLGKRGLRNYSRDRLAETNQIENFRDGDCFHDGQSALLCVENYHRSALDNAKRSDTVTSQVIEHLIGSMLDHRSEARLSAQQLWFQSEKIIRRGRQNLKDISLGGSRKSSLSKAPRESSYGSVNDQPRRHGYSGGPDLQGSLDRGSMQNGPPTQWFSRPGTNPLPIPANTSPEHSFMLSPASTFPKIEEHPESSNQITDMMNDLSTRQKPMDAYYTPPQPHPYDPSPPRTGSSFARHSRGATPGTSPPRPIRPFSSNSVTATGLGFETNTFDVGESSQATSQDPRAVTHMKNLARVSGEPNHRKSQPTLDESAPNIAEDTKATKKRISRPVPKLSVAEAINWKNEKKRGKNAMLEADYLLQSLNQRDHVFLVDDSTSMERHWEKLRTLVGILAYMTKDADPDGLELYFTISPRKLKSKKATHFVDQLAITRPHGLSDISMRLSSILQEYQQKLAFQTQPKTRWTLSTKQKYVRPLNVYVLTDGVWQDLSDASPPIRSLVQKLVELQLGKHQVGITFIRFGDSDVGGQRLEKLDSGLGLDLDIVDCEEADGNVWKMLLGGINPWFDQENG